MFMAATLNVHENVRMTVRSSVLWISEIPRGTPSCFCSNSMCCRHPGSVGICRPARELCLCGGHAGVTVWTGLYCIEQTWSNYGPWTRYSPLVLLIRPTKHWFKVRCRLISILVISVDTTKWQQTTNMINYLWMFRFILVQLIRPTFLHPTNTEPAHRSNSEPHFGLWAKTFAQPFLRILKNVLRHPVA